ncbi:oligosaccharide flippase family protein [Rubrivivax rivuli]|uniref:Polysaccharide biosynthesis protein n=1 Tax=Rubrivivax rivuli TaxID=1862385 RepID=A0A437RE96_9BURK|nr:oligosaccharide flippase family protein [Rubrivivax rivuli]RVU45086.1 hypothetical protein EOE66_13075 [Rubrivivax rivuli]
MSIRPQPPATVSASPGLAMGPGPAPAALLRGLLNQRRLRQLLGFAAAQGGVQLLGFVAGLLLVRWMAPADYGHYTAAVALLSLVSVMLDLGLSSAMLSLGGPHHADRAALARLQQAARRLQWRLFGLLLLPLAALGALLLGDPALSLPATAALVGLCLLLGLVNARNALAIALMRLQGQAALQQKLEFAVHAARVCSVAGAGVGVIDIGIGALLMALPTLLLAAALRWAAPAWRPDAGPATAHAEAEAAEGAAAAQAEGHAARLQALVARQAPNSVYYCLSAQLPVALVAWLGQAQQVAEVGALSRLAMLFTVLSNVLAALVAPYFARPRLAGELRTGFGLVNAGFALLCAALGTLALLLPGPLLWVLGPQYLHLKAETPWMVLSTTLSVWAGAVYAIGAARGWIVPALLNIPLGLLALLAALLLFDAGTAAGAFQINTAVAAASVLLLVGYTAWRLLGNTRLWAPGVRQ